MSSKNTAYLGYGYGRVDPFTKQNIKDGEQEAIQQDLF